MKKFVSLLLALTVLIPCLLTSCGAKKTVHSITSHGRVYDICGKGSHRTVIVTENGVQIWETRVDVEKKIGKQDGTYGLAILDLNFDGLDDIKISISETDEKITALCYLQNPTTGLYDACNVLSEIYTVDAVADKQLLLSYDGISKDAITGVTVESITAYRWQGDGLIPYRRLSITYYPTENRYCYGTSDYLDGSLRFDDPDETWLTPEQYRNTDWSFFYYFR